MSKRSIALVIFSVWCLHCFTYVELYDCFYCKYDSINYISKETFKIYKIQNCSYTNKHLSSCKIRTVYKDAFKDMNNLRELLLNDNVIEYLDIATFRDTWNLNRLYLSNNEILLLETGLFANLSYLTYLSLKGNKLQSVAPNLFANLKSLTDLDLRHNLITEVDKHVFCNNTKLQILDLSSNRITHLDVALFQNNIELFDLRVNKNNIKYIEDGLFTNLKHLHKLHMFGNSIKNIAKNAFPVTSTLAFIDLSSNQLEHLDVNLFNKLTGLTRLELYNNSWYCNYKLKDLHALYTKYKSSQEPICNQPMELHNKTWNSVNRIDFQSLEILSHQVHLHEGNARFSCYIKADPVLKVTWYYNNILLHEESNNSYEFTNDDLGNGTLVFYLTVPIVHLKETDTFSCHAAILYGIAHRVFDNFIKSPEPFIHKNSFFLGLIICILLITFIVATAAFVYWIKLKFKEPEPDITDFRVKEMFELLNEHEAKQRVERKTRKNNRA